MAITMREARAAARAMGLRITEEEWQRSARVIPAETHWRLNTGVMDGAQIAEAFECLHEALRQAGWRPDQGASGTEDDDTA